MPFCGQEGIIVEQFPLHGYMEGNFIENKQGQLRQSL
jgi:hypothetical protein